jgi:hypothetical protein
VSDVARPGRGAGLYVCWHRSEVDDRDHAVTDEEFAHGRRDAQGRYEALCGHVVLPCSMLVPPGRPCGRCRAYLVARSTLPTVEQRVLPPRHRKPSRWRRLVRGSSDIPAGAGSALIAPVPAGRHALRGER